MATQPVSSPGIALNTDFLHDQPLKLIMKGEGLSRDFTISLEDGTPLFQVDSETFSNSHRKHIIECRTGHELFTIRKENFSMRYRYYAEVPDGSGNMLFETVTSSGFLKGPTTAMDFRNALQNGQNDQLQLVGHNFSGESEILWRDQQVAEIYKESFKLRSEYHLAMVAGMDPLLVVVLAVIMDDRARTQRQRRNA